MKTLYQIKEQTVTETPLILFDCTLPGGAEEHWSTHKVTVENLDYEPRVLRHNLFDQRWGAEEGIDTLTRVAITLANADSQLSQLARNQGFKGAKLRARFVFFDLKGGAAATIPIVLFQGLVNPVDEITESTLRLSAYNRLNLQRYFLPEVRIQRRCPWSFPSNTEQRTEALDGGTRGKYSPFLRCGYSADLQGGIGNLDAQQQPYTTCDYTRSACQARGMFDKDSRGNLTRRFGGVEFVPSSIAVRSHGENGSHASVTAENEARYNDYVPLNYGTGWISPPVVFARNDGNLTKFEVLLGSGEINSVMAVVVNNTLVPLGVNGKDMTATGWYNVVSRGTLEGGFNLDFADAAGKPLGDPYGSMAYLAVAVPNKVSDGRTVPQVKVLLEGIKLATWDATGQYLGEAFTNNPAWIVLDLLWRSGWSLDELDIPSFAVAAGYCDQAVQAPDLHGNPQPTPRFQCNLQIRRRKSVADVLRGVRTASRLYLRYGDTGLLELHVEGTLGLQQPNKPAGSNSAQPLLGGWPAYEFSDGSDGASGILRKSNGEASVRLWSRSTAEAPNRYSLEFQDAFNEYQQDSLSLVDVDDVSAMHQEVSATSPALGVPTFHQAARVLKLHLDRALRGNLFIEFETSVKGVGLRPGDLITVTYQKEGFSRQPFRVTRLTPGLNHQTVTVEAQLHDDSWYGDDPNVASSSTVSRRRGGAEIGLPLPLIGAVLDSAGEQQFSIAEEAAAEADGGAAVTLQVGFAPPSRPSAGHLDIPLLSLQPSVSATGGTLPGGQVYYYAISAVAADGSESDLSFLVRAATPAGGSTASVTLRSLSFSQQASAFNVYRGSNPVQLLRIASNVALAGSYTDTGAVAQLQGPPDENYDHAVFEWRMELQPEVAATSFGPDFVASTALQLNADEFAGMTVRITTGTGAGQERVILTHTVDTLTVKSSWTTVPDGTSKFAITESSWNFGAQGASTPVRFQVPNRPGATVEVCGRAVNALGRDSGYELALVTRWRIGGSSGSMGDTDVPPMPVFGMEVGGQGTVNLVAVSFADLTNTGSVFAGTLQVYYWNELASPSTTTLTADLAGSAIDFAWNGGPLEVGALVQIESEIAEVDTVDAVTGAITLIRGSHGTNPVTHVAGTTVYPLEMKTLIVPFSPGFFGSRASGSYTFPIYLADARIAAANLFATNSRGNGETQRIAFTQNANGGLRTLSGGQLTLQYEGHLAIQADAGPPLVIESSHSVRDIFATVALAPSGGQIDIQVNVGGVAYCALTIPDGATRSNVVDGFGLPPLTAMSDLRFDITAVPQGVGVAPGRDLTITIRL